MTARTLHWSLDDAGWLQSGRRLCSVNCDERPPGTEITMAVVHAISLPPGEFGGDGVEWLFTNRLDPDAHPYYRQIQALRVSAHFFIRRDGEIIQFVPCRLRAWHAGASRWRDRERCNDFSIGIELEGSDDQPFEPVQYEILGRLLRTLKSHYPIRDIVGHADISPDRKTDPGPCFNWAYLYRII
jgi:AmpD protein